MSTPLKNAVRQWAATGTGIPLERVFWSKQNATRKAYPYVTLNVIADVTVHRDEKRKEEQGGRIVTTIYENKLVTVQVKVVNLAAGSDAVPPPTADSFMSRARIMLKTDGQEAAFEAAGIALNNTGGLVDLDDQDGERWLSVCAMDVSFNAVESYTDPVSNDYVETAELTGTDPDDETLIDGDFGIGHPF